MRTRMPISTISYNTEPFLRGVLDELTDSKIIEFWFYVKHKAEEDEGGLKDHIHVFIVPCGTIDTSSLIDHFKEPILDDLSKKPLRSLPFKSSKTDDAIMYFLHDKSYLAYKNQSRRFHYQLSDVVSSDEDEFNFYYKSIDISRITPYKKMLDAQEIGMTFGEYVKHGYIPVQMISNYQTAWYLLQAEKVNRNGRNGHDIDENDFVECVDSSTGEVVTKYPNVE